MTKFIGMLWQRTAWLRSGIGLAILAVAFVGLRLLWIHIQRPAHLEANAAAYGSIRNFYGKAWINHDGSQFVYVATADDRGRAVFLCDTATGKRRQIIEDRHGVGGYGWNDDFDIQAGPWSPDDSCFLCWVSNRMTICPVDANHAPGFIEEKPFSEAAWLAPTKFAFVTDGTNLCVGQKRTDGKWERKLILNHDVPLTSLTAINSDVVAWLEFSNVICRVSVSEGYSGGDASSPNTDKGGAAPLPPSATEASQPPSQPPANGLALWLDTSRLRLPDQSPIQGLPDLSRSRNDTVWNGRPPVFNGTNSALALNGQGTIHFGWVNSPTNGTGLKTRAPFGITGAAARSVFAVMRHEAGQAMMVSMGDTRTNGALFAVEGERDRFYLPGGWYLDNQVMMTSTNWNLLEVTYDGAEQRGYINGILRGVAHVRLDTAKKEVEIGYRTATGGRNPKTAEGDFAELLVYDRALSESERRQVEDYLGGKWFGKEFSPEDPLVWHDTGLDGLTGMAYSKETEMLLLGRTDNGKDSIWRLDTADGPDAFATRVMDGEYLRDMQWVGRSRFAYATRELKRIRLALADVSGTGEKLLLGTGNFDWFKATSDEKQLFLYGNISNQPSPGIWRYDVASDALRPVISVSDYPSGDAQAVIKSSGSYAAPSGGNVSYTLYRPAKFDKHKKHPLVLGDTFIKDAIYGEPFMTGMAACGASVAVVERPWWGANIEQWAQKVRGLYEALKVDPTVDTRRIYLFAASGETQYLCQLVETNPAPWRGLILLNPGPLPDFSKSPWFQSRPKILMDAGGEEHEEGRFKQYQEKALDSGVVVEFYTHPGETHRTVGIDAKLNRARELKHFIFEE